MRGTGNDARRSASTPLLTAEVAFAVLGVMAFVTGVQKRWILDPVGDAFNDLPPDAKAAIAVFVVVATAAWIATVQLRRRRMVVAARQMIDRRLGE